MTDQTASVAKVARRPSDKPVYSYTQLIEDVAKATGLKKSHVRKALEATQQLSATFLRSKTNGRVHFGRFGVLHSRMTAERQVNNPQKPGEHVTSMPHLVIRFEEGTHTKAFLQGAPWETSVDKDE